MSKKEKGDLAGGDALVAGFGDANGRDGRPVLRGCRNQLLCAFARTTPSQQKISTLATWDAGIISFFSHLS